MANDYTKELTYILNQVRDLNMSVAVAEANIIKYFNLRVKEWADANPVE